MNLGWAVKLAGYPPEKVCGGGAKGVIWLRRVQEHFDKGLLLIGREHQLMLLERPGCRLAHCVDHELLQTDAAERGRPLEEGLLLGIDTSLQPFGLGPWCACWGCHKN